MELQRHRYASLQARSALLASTPPPVWAADANHSGAFRVVVAILCVSRALLPLLITPSIIVSQGTKRKEALESVFPCQVLSHAVCEARESELDVSYLP
jgi:hypothetical protein